ncbi:MAG: 50S ribosomal protein L22 [Endomicrobium sp.]|nr:50S ribosomal protein L22 [Endomicrobium sp.]
MKYIRYTPRKANQLLSLIRNKKLNKAFEILSFIRKSVSMTNIIKKMLKNALANVGQLDINYYENFIVKEAWVGQGPTLKRIHPGPRGRGMPIKKRTVHITLVVAQIIKE